MRPSKVVKRRETVIPALLLCAALFIGAAAGAERQGDEAGTAARPYVLRDVRIETGVVLRASSERFVIEWTISEGKEEGETLELAGGRRPPSQFGLSQNYPNPFNPATTIAFEVPGVAGERAAVSLHVYDVRGRHVKTLVDADLEAGAHRVVWDGRNEAGVRVSSGVYFSILKKGDRSAVRKMVVCQ